MDNRDRERHVERFTLAVLNAAFDDHAAEIDERDNKYNSGERLRTRLNLDQYRVSPRKGDAKAARGLYSEFRFLLKTEVE